MSIPIWERRLVQLVEDFWLENKGAIGRYQATLHDGTKVSITYPAKKPKPVSGDAARRPA